MPLVGFEFCQRGNHHFQFDGSYLVYVSPNFTLHTVDTEVSILATLGRACLGFFDPLGFGNWKATVAALQV